MSRLIILVFNREKEDNYILDKMNETPEVSVYPVLRDVGFIGKCIRRFHFSFFPFYVDFWFSKKWTKIIKKDDTVVCMGNYWSSIILKRIAKKYRCRCINYFWDKVSISGYPVVSSRKYENWTFDLEDSQTYHMKYNPQFYVENLVDDQPIKYDVFFVVADRGGNLKERVSMANDYYSKMRKLDLDVFFYLLTSSPDANSEIAYHVPLDTKKALNLMMSSKAVLEITNPGTAEWLTLRPFQALTNHRKLITNSKKIASYDFYNPKNIFIIGQDSWSNLPDFLNAPFEPEECLNNYSLSNWKKRFLTDNTATKFREIL